MNKQISLFGSTIVAILLVSIFFNYGFAENQKSHTELFPLNDSIGLEKTTLLMYVPEDNHLPWAYVEGKIANPVLEYPVIIQIFDVNNYEELEIDKFEKENLVEKIGAVHFAQTNVNNDGTYEHKFRVLGYDDDGQKNYFEGEYVVKIFKVVYLQNLT